jgi:hypothetical protein
MDQPRVLYESLAANKHADFMLRMRLSLDCGCAAVATQGGSDNLFTVESLAALMLRRQIKIKNNAGEIRTLVLELHEREGWRALGYKSWRARVVAEFEHGQTHLYRLLGLQFRHCSVQLCNCHRAFP